MFAINQILFCDDSEFIRETVRLSADELPNATIHFAKDGKEAQNKIVQRSFDLIVLDLEMPFLSGSDLVRLIRQDQHSSVPIIVLTGHSKESEEVAQLKQFEIDSILHKPFSPSILFDYMIKVIARPAVAS